MFKVQMENQINSIKKKVNYFFLATILTNQKLPLMIYTRIYQEV